MGVKKVGGKGSPPAPSAGSSKQVGKQGTTEMSQDSPPEWAVAMHAELTKSGGQFARVGFSAGVTRNLGNYESARADAWMDLPCPVGQEGEAFDRCRDFVDDRLAVVVSEIESV